MIIQSQSEAAVGSYDIGKSMDFMERLGKEKRKGKDFPDPMFSSTTKRIPPISKDKGVLPGPGFYEAQTTTIDTFQPSACFSTGLDRFGNSTKLSRNLAPITPGPGEYAGIHSSEKCRYDEKRESSNIGFASSCPRFESIFCDDQTPGPDHYRPSSNIYSKKSFYFNRNRQYCQWV